MTQAAEKWFPDAPESEREQFGADHDKHLVEQYKLFVTTAEQVSARRLSANSANIAINAAIITFYGVVSKGEVPGKITWEVVISLLGLAICANWYLYIRSSRILNAVKFDLIHKMEKHLPINLFDEEWRLLQKRKYTSFTSIESRLPLVIATLYLILGVVSVIKAIRN